MTDLSKMTKAELIRLVLAGAKQREAMQARISELTFELDSARLADCIGPHITGAFISKGGPVAVPKDGSLPAGCERVKL